ncbi:unnamed protein product [Ostreobium quekettii]|uniref:FCP1 homology domain-containing protein n=1 Tax=Ostreobium quekettii TaxID=121088 RepID=A0A8S1IXC7_9CHLO|nr:unnamed protein product [Ostreobium quekettii]
MEAGQRARSAPAPARGVHPLELVLAVWHFLRLLFSGLAALAAYLSAPLSWLGRHARTSQAIMAGPARSPRRPPALRASPEPRRPAKWLLPPLMASDFGKMTVVLDLDETLISSRPAKNAPARLRPGGLRSVELDCDGTSVGKSSRVVMFMRPGLFEFLSRLTSFAEVVLFTAGVPAYAEPLANALDPARRFFSARLYRGDTVATVWHSYVKDLSKLGRDLRRTVLVDNSPYSFLLQPANGIPCVPFRGAGGDQQLLKVILPLLECLSYVHDIRPVLNNHFKMASWFRARGCNVELDL